MSLYRCDTDQDKGGKTSDFAKALAFQEEEAGGVPWAHSTHLEKKRAHIWGCPSHTRTRNEVTSPSCHLPMDIALQFQDQSEITGGRNLILKAFLLRCLSFKVLYLVFLFLFFNFFVVAKMLLSPPWEQRVTRLHARAGTAQPFLASHQVQAPAFGFMSEPLTCGSHFPPSGRDEGFVLTLGGHGACSYAYTRRRTSVLWSKKKRSFLLTALGVSCSVSDQSCTSHLVRNVVFMPMGNPFLGCYYYYYFLNTSHFETADVLTVSVWRLSSAIC